MGVGCRGLGGGTAGHYHVIDLEVALQLASRKLVCDQELV
jgi:hypothetical protein